MRIERRLAYTPPLDSDALLAFFARRAVPGVEEVADGSYRRSLPLPHGAGVAELRPSGGRLRCRLWLDDERDAAEAIDRCRRLFDLGTDPAPIARHLRRDPLIGALVRASPGRRVPGSADGFEIAVRAVLGQQVSLAGAATLAARLVREHGEPLSEPQGGITHLFPTPAALGQASGLPMPRSRAAALKALAEANTLDPDELLRLPGIGPWTVAYIRMRALRDKDAFMPTDLGVKRALAKLGEDPEAAEQLAERWRPFRAYAMQQLWAIP